VAKKPVRKANNPQFVGLLIAVAVVGVAAIGYAVTRPSAAPLTVDPNLPPGAATGHLIGNPNAPVKVMEFGDFECPGCGNFANVTEPDVRSRLINTGIVQFRYYDFPLTQHKNSWTAHLAASCAEEQGKFWEMHDRIYAGQDEWSDLVNPSITDPLKIFRGYAKDLGLDVKKWEDCVVTQKPAAAIKGNQAEGVRRGISQTPTIIIGDKQVNGLTYDEFKKLVDDALADVNKAKADSIKKSGAKKGAAQ
jgi:protein-disulfide isomerase